MGKSTFLSPAKRATILSLKKAGNLYERGIAQKLGVSRGAVRSTVRKFKATGSYENAPKSGRPRRTTVVESVRVYIRLLISIYRVLY